MYTRKGERKKNEPVTETAYVRFSPNVSFAEGNPNPKRK